MITTKPLTASFTVLALVLVLTGCTAAGDPAADPLVADNLPRIILEAPVRVPTGPTVGVSLPATDSPGELFESGLPNADFRPMVLLANSVSEQKSQIKEMIDAGAEVIIIQAIDGSGLVKELASAKKAGIPVIAYNYLLRGSKNVNAFIAYGLCETGRAQATSLLAGLAERSDGPYNVELIAGPSDDGNAKLFFDCAMQVLKPKINDGTVVVPSGQVKRQQVSTPSWLAESMQKRLESILAEFYADNTPLDGILSPVDFLTRAAITTVEAAGRPAPIVTGGESEEESVRWVASGKQHSTLYRSTHTMVTEAISLARQLHDGKKIAFTDTKTFNNGVKVVPAYLLYPVTVTQENVCTVYDPDTLAGRAAAETPLCQE